MSCTNVFVVLWLKIRYKLNTLEAAFPLKSHLACQLLLLNTTAASATVAQIRHMSVEIVQTDHSVASSIHEALPVCIMSSVKKIVGVTYFSFSFF